MSRVNAGILGTGYSYPKGVLTNADLEKIVDTSDEWITTRTGIKQRRKAAPDEYTSQFAVGASREAIERAGIDPVEIDLILCATVTPDQILPSTACLIQAELGAHKAAAMDIVAACSGFLYGLTLADSMIRGGQAKYVLVIGAEILTRYVDYTDRSTCLLFGDGAGAAVLGAVESDRGILSAKIRSDGRYEDQLYAPGGGSKLNVDESMVYSNIAMHGNTSSASIPIGLDECVASGKVQEGDVVLMASFGGGVTWGAVVMRW